MFSLRKPLEVFIRERLTRQTNAPFSYEAVGATRGMPPPNYKVNHHRVQLGTGVSAFEAACQAIRQWKMFSIDWVELCWPNAPIQPETIVGVVIRAGGLWSLNFAKIVYVLDRPDDTADQRERFGFAYGTLPEHAERGEERFSVEWRTDDSVWYDLYAFSQPRHWLARLGGPITRRFQSQFALDSLKAMQRAVQTSQGTG